MPKIFLSLILLFSFSFAMPGFAQSRLAGQDAKSVHGGDAAPLSETGGSSKLQPSMRAVDRDWDYFESIPCGQLAKQVFHSASEEKLLAKRKSQCLQRYKAFMPDTVHGQ